MIFRSSFHFSPQRGLFTCFVVFATLLAVPGCKFELPTGEQVYYDRFDLSTLRPIEFPARTRGLQITEYAVEYIVDLGIPDGEPGHDSEVRVVLPNPMPKTRVPALVVNGAGAYLFSGMVLSDEDIDPMLPYVKRGFAVVAYETDGCQPDFDRDPTPDDVEQMTRRYVASKAGLINAERALDYALTRFPEIDGSQLYAIGHSSGGKQALLLAAHDHRIRGCVAFAPACRMDFPTAMTLGRIEGPDKHFLVNEVKRSMPIAHAKDTQVPMFLVYSQTDRVTRPGEVIEYAKEVGDLARVFPLQGKEHWQVPKAGFDLAIAWLSAQVNGVSTVQTASRRQADPNLPRNVKNLNAPAQISNTIKSNPFAD